MPRETRTVRLDDRSIPMHENSTTNDIWLITHLVVVAVLLWAVIVLVRATVGYLEGKTKFMRGHSKSKSVDKE